MTPRAGVYGADMDLELADGGEVLVTSMVQDAESGFGTAEHPPDMTFGVFLVFRTCAST
jgi:hypothetical protein